MPKFRWWENHFISIKSVLCWEMSLLPLMMEDRGQGNASPFPLKVHNWLKHWARQMPCERISIFSFLAPTAQPTGFVVKRVQGETDGLRSFGLYKNFKETNKPKQTLTTDSGFLSEGQDFWTQYSDKTVFLGRNEGEWMKCVMWTGRSTETGLRTRERMACPGGLPTSS